MPHPLLTIATNAAIQAGKMAMRHYDRLNDDDITEKSANDFVTKVDYLAEQIIIETIHKSYPEHSILAEESGEHQHSADYRWIIDPIDGTANFIHSFPHFAISIGCEHKGQLLVGVVYNPVLQELFTAVQGQGAYCNNRRIRVGRQEKLAHAVVASEIPITASDDKLQRHTAQLTKLIPMTGGTRSPGSDALDLAYVAAGRLDGLWILSAQPWDIAAGLLLVQEAGGVVSDLIGGKDCLNRGEVLAANPSLHNKLLPYFNA